MGSYISVEAKIWSKNWEVFNSKEEVLDKIEENKKEISNLKKQIFGLCCGNIKDLLNCKDSENYNLDPIEVLESKLDVIFEDEICGLEALICQNYRLQYFYENWDKIERDN